MTRPQYRAQLRTLKWKNFRTKMFAFLGKRCVICGTDKRLQLHHKWYIDGRAAWEYTSKDMAVMCRKDHIAYHKEFEINFYDEKLKLKYKKFI